MLTEFVYGNLFKGFILQTQKFVFFYSGVFIVGLMMSKNEKGTIKVVRMNFNAIFKEL